MNTYPKSTLMYDAFDRGAEAARAGKVRQMDYASGTFAPIAWYKGYDSVAASSVEKVPVPSWDDFLHHRARVIRDLHDLGKLDVEIVTIISVDAVQVRAITKANK